MRRRERHGPLRTPPAHSSRHQIAFIPLVSPLHEPKSVGEVIASYREWLHGYFDLELSPASSPKIRLSAGAEDAAGLIALVVTGGTERLIRSVAKIGKPLVILAHEFIEITARKLLPLGMERNCGTVSRSSPIEVVGATFVCWG